MNHRVFATVRGIDVPMHAARGRVVVSTTAAAYALLGDTLVALRDSRSAQPATRTASSVLAPVGPEAWLPGAEVRIDHGMVQSTVVTVDLDPAPVWQPPDAAAVVDLPAAADRLARLVDAPHRQHDLAPHIERLTRAIAGGTPADVDAALRALIGRGPGLTPSGDDVVTGLLAAAQRTGNRSIVERLAPTVDALQHRTTIVSGHQLAAACRGTFAEPVLALVDALVAADPADAPALARCAAALRALHGVGATTGTDTVAGVAAGIELLAPRDHPRCGSTMVLGA